jgi:hypothetical protein
MSKYKIYIDKDVDSNDMFYNHFSSGQGIVCTKLSPYGSGIIYIGKANSGMTNDLKSFDVDFNLPQSHNPIDVINIKNKLPAGVQARYNNIGSASNYFSYIGSGLQNGSTAFGSFVRS